MKKGFKKLVSKGLLVFIILVYGPVTVAQTAKIVSKNDDNPIEDVLIFNKTQKKSQLSNSHGEFSLKDYEDQDILFIQHPTYNIIELPVQEIKKNNNIIQLTEKTILLEKILISASKWEQKRGEVPNKISMITAKEIEFENPQTSADLIGSTGEVFIQKSQMGGGSPMIRGFAANSVLLVFDGIRMNNAIYRSGNLQNIITIDPNIIETSEVIFGPGTVIYGSDALGGVMAFKSKQPSLSFTEKHFSANVLGRYNSGNNENTIHVDFNLGYKKFASYSSISVSKFGDQKMGSNGPDEYLRTHYFETIDGKDSTMINSNPETQVGTGYSQINLMQKFRYRPSDEWELNYSIYYTTSTDIPRYDRLTQYKDGNLKYADWYYGPQTWSIQNFNIQHHRKTKLYDNFKITLGQQYLEESRHDRKFGKDELRSRTEKVRVSSFNMDLEKHLSKNSSLYYGIETLFNHVKSEGISTNINTNEVSITGARYPDSVNLYFANSVYANLKNKIGEKLFLNTGLRFNNSNLMSKFSFNSPYDFPFDEIILYNSSFNGSAGLSYLPDLATQYTFNISTGYRAPNLDDIGKVFDSEPGSVIVPNKDLEPEYVLSTDFGYIKDFTECFGIELNIFGSYLFNAMVRRDFSYNNVDSIMYDGEMSKVQAIVNADHALVAGISGKTHVDFTKYLRLDANASYIWGEDSDGLPVRHVAPFYGQARLSYKHKHFKSQLVANYNGEISAENLAESEKSKTHMYLANENGDLYSPSWWTLDIKNSFTWKKKYSLTLNLNNILDVRYRPYSSGIVAPGRNVSIALKAKI